MDQREEEKSIRLRVYGIVQGVGFRPYAAKLARRYGIAGSVKNKGGMVEIVAQGAPSGLSAFADELLSRPPANALIVHHQTENMPAAGLNGFSIEPSENSEGPVFLSPDLPVCADCLRELADPANRRFRHPLISCMSCGPRFSMIEDAPYDRDTTTMRDFVLCPACGAEYADRGDRRYHAQTISCHDCGPYLIYRQNGSVAEREAALQNAIETLKSGGIVAVKGIGGYHLACSPFKQNTVLHLREMKRREQKPFAVMFPDLEDMKKQCMVSAAEEALLLSAARPIVLLEKGECTLAPSVCNKSRYVGAFLPYTPLQAMLLQACGPLIMTSANLSEEPILSDDADMMNWPGPDGVLYHRRRISVRQDDSVVRAMDGGVQLIRRSRGYAPLPIILKEFEGSGSRVFAAGGQLKAAFCLASGPFAYMSQHIGDLDHEGSMAEYEANYARMKRVFRVEPELAVCDMHPAYAASAFAKSLGLPVFTVQHHHAHIASVMAEHNLGGPVIGIAFDGVGYGADGSVWGAEFLICEGDTFRRAGCLKPVPFLGGDEAMRDAARSAMFHLRAAGLERDIRDERWPVLRAALTSGVGAYPCSSMGRLFDAVSAILGVCAYNRFEGECAIDLENLAAEALRCSIRPMPLRFTIAETGGLWSADASPVIEELVRAKDADLRALALGFHRAVEEMALVMCRKMRDHTGIHAVVLSGGTMQNAVLLSGLARELTAAGFSVYKNEAVPPNDGGIALGQAYIGLKRLQRKESPCV